MKHLITKEQITELARPISANLPSQRVDNYISEAEMSIIKPAIGDAFFVSLFSDEPSDAITLLLDGGQYLMADGSVRVFSGLRVALAYYAYAKIVKNNSISVTSSGVKDKNGDYSQSVDSRQVMRVHDDARDYGDSCMASVLAFLTDRAADYPLFVSGTPSPVERSQHMSIYSIGN